MSAHTLRAMSQEAATREIHVRDAAPELLAALRVFVGCAYQVSTEIDARGHEWCVAWLDEALPIARAAIAKAEGRA